MQLQTKISDLEDSLDAMRSQRDAEAERRSISEIARQSLQEELDRIVEELEVEKTKSAGQISSRDEEITKLQALLHTVEKDKERLMQKLALAQKIAAEVGPLKQAKELLEREMALLAKEMYGYRDTLAKQSDQV